MLDTLGRAAYVALGRAARAARSTAKNEGVNDAGRTNAASEGISYRDELEDLMIAMRALHRVDLDAEQPERPQEMRTLLKTPVHEWLGIGRDEPLLIQHGRRAEMTGYAEQVLSETGSYPEREEAQDHVGRVQKKLRARYEEGTDGEKKRVEETYRRFRRGIIECAVPTFEEACKLTRGVEVDVADLFVRIPEARLVEVNGSEGAFPCPLCGYPMKIFRQEDRVACSSARCRQHGAQFSWADASEMPVSLSGDLSGDRAEFVPTEERDRFRLRPGIWISTVLPGLLETSLYQRLSRHAEVRLWPEVDRYDLHVTTERKTWRVDVKDWNRADELYDQLSSRVPSRTIWIVVPDDRDHQVEFLKRSDLSRRYRFASASELVREVRSTRS